jgi:hypothetical protein
VTAESGRTSLDAATDLREENMLKTCSLCVLALSLGMAGSALAQTKQDTEKKPAATVESQPKSGAQGAGTQAGGTEGSGNTSHSGSASETGNASHSGAKRPTD